MCLGSPVATSSRGPYKVKPAAFCAAGFTLYLALLTSATRLLPHEHSAFRHVHQGARFLVGAVHRTSKREFPTIGKLRAFRGPPLTSCGKLPIQPLPSPRPVVWPFALRHLDCNENTSPPPLGAQRNKQGRGAVWRSGAPQRRGARGAFRGADAHTRRYEKCHVEDRQRIVVSPILRAQSRIGMAAEEPHEKTRPPADACYSPSKGGVTRQSLQRPGMVLIHRISKALFRHGISHNYNCMKFIIGKHGT